MGREWGKTARNGLGTKVELQEKHPAGDPHCVDARRAARTGEPGQVTSTVDAWNSRSRRQTGPGRTVRHSASAASAGLAPRSAHAQQATQASNRKRRGSRRRMGVSAEVPSCALGARMRDVSTHQPRRAARVRFGCWVFFDAACVPARVAPPLPAGTALQNTLGWGHSFAPHAAVCARPTPGRGRHPWQAACWRRWAQVGTRQRRQAAPQGACFRPSHRLRRRRSRRRRRGQQQQRPCA